LEPTKIFEFQITCLLKKGSTRNSTESFETLITSVAQSVGVLWSNVDSEATAMAFAVLKVYCNSFSSRKLWWILRCKMKTVI